MKELVRAGLLEDNLWQLIDACKENLETDPITFFVLESIFERILNTYWDNHQLPKEQYQELGRLQPLILDALENAGTRNFAALETLINECRKLGMYPKLGQ